MRHLTGFEEKLIAFIALLSVFFFALSIIMICTQSAEYIGPKVAEIALTCMIVSILIAVLGVVMYGVMNHYDKGIAYGNTYAKIHYSLRQALYDADFVEKDLLGFVFFPRIEIVFNKALTRGKIYIQNSPRLSKPLEKFNVSSALGSYVVDRWYLSNDQNYYIYEIVDSQILKSVSINSLAEFENVTKSNSKYTLMVAPETEIRLQHMLICGATRSGKTYFLYVLILLLLRTLRPQQYLYFADPKESSIWNLGNLLKLKHNAYDFDDIVTELKDFHNVLLERQQRLSVLQKAKLDSDYRDFSLSPYVFVFDEFASFMGALQTKPKSERDTVMSILKDVVLMGAGTGCFIWIVMQKSDSSSLPTMIRDNLTAKFVFGSAEDTTYTTCFGPGVEIPNRDFKTGEGVYTEAGYVNTPKLICVPTLNFDIADAMKQAANLAPVM